MEGGSRLYLLPCRVTQQLSVHSSQRKHWEPGTNNSLPSTCRNELPELAAGSANKFSRPQGQELPNMMVAFDATQTKSTEVLVTRSVETPTRS